MCRVNNRFPTLSEDSHNPLPACWGHRPCSSDRPSLEHCQPIRSHQTSLFLNGTKIATYETHTHTHTCANSPQPQFKFPMNERNVPRYLKFPSCLGMVPERKLPFNLISFRLDIFPNSVGIGPSRLFLYNCRFSELRNEWNVTMGTKTAWAELGVANTERHGEYRTYPGAIACRFQSE